MLYSILLLILASSVGIGALGMVRTTYAGGGATRYQQVADAARWEWNSTEANPLHSMLQQAGQYEVTLASDPKSRFQLRIAIMNGGKVIYSWEGPPASVFSIRGDCLFYIRFTPDSSGGIVVAVDLATAEEIWSSPLEALGPVAHSTYQTQFVIASVNDDVITIYGNESAGRYIEIKDAKTGETVGHRIFGKK